MSSLLGIFLSCEKMFLVFLRYVLVCLVVLESAHSSCPFECFCVSTSRGHVVECHAGGFTDIPTPLFADTSTLVMNGNNISTLHNNNFIYLSQLKQLRLDNNMISEIEVGAFRNLSMLQELTLAQNQLTTLQIGIFDGLVSLTKLDLSENMLTFVPPKGVWDDVINMVNLNFKKNLIVTEPTNEFLNLWNLTILDISFNSLSGIGDECLKSMGRLRELKMDGNNFTSIPTTALSRLPSKNMVYLGLSSNRINRIDDFAFDVDSLRSLETLTMWSNLITDISNDAFKNVPRLATLLLGVNRLTTLNSIAFSKLTGIRMLNLLGNPLLCDCDMIDFVHWSQNRTELHLLGDCRTPANLKGALIEKLSSADLRCTSALIDTDNFPSAVTVAEGEDATMCCLVNRGGVSVHWYTADGTFLSNLTCLQLLNVSSMSDTNYECVAILNSLYDTETFSLTVLTPTKTVMTSATMQTELVTDTAPDTIPHLIIIISVAVGGGIFIIFLIVCCVALRMRRFSASLDIQASMPLQDTKQTSTYVTSPKDGHDGVNFMTYEQTDSEKPTTQ
uniref:Leucine-rich repeat-containing protein 70-like n=1 Tax=Saccoglossus kowalevskii TaxID=10224 RepID=A0ABM0M149_SACKO|nr:PREDICTED: leucine-rich repeat-containing protein 70-like [Saccoglossus kowalevskii]